MSVRLIVVAAGCASLLLGSPAWSQTGDVPAADAGLLVQQPPAPSAGRATPPPPRVAVQPAPRPSQPLEPPQGPQANPRIITIPEAPLQNVRVDLTITDQRGGSAPVRKTVTITAADRMLSRIRTTSSFTQPAGEVPLNVDVTPAVRAGGRISVNLGLEYVLPVSPAAGDTPRGPSLYRTAISETLNVILEDGKPLVIAQSADPVSDRQVTIELKATILK